MIEFKHFWLCAGFQRALLNRSEGIWLYTNFLETCIVFKFNDNTKVYSINLRMQ
jgi:hypothetical protein